MGGSIDISERKQLEKRLSESEELYRSIVENIHVGLAIIENGKTIYANNRVCEIFGYLKFELVKLTDFDFATPEEKERLQGIVEETKRTGFAPKELEFWIARKDGARRCIQNRYSIIGKGDWSTRIVTTIDVTERQKALEKLKVLNEKLNVVGKLTRHDVRSIERTEKTALRYQWK